MGIHKKHLRLGEWLSDSKFWRVFSPLVFSDFRWQRASFEIDALLTLAPIKPGAAVIDAGAGTGRHSLELSRRGFAVTAIESNSDYIRALRSSCKAESLEINIQHNRIEDFQPTLPADLVLSAYTSLGYGKDENDDKNLLELFFRWTNSWLVLETLCLDDLKTQKEEWFEYDNNWVMTARNLEGNRLNNRWVLANGKHVWDYQFAQMVYSKAQLIEMLGSIGFKIVETRTGWGETALEAERESIIIIAKKEFAR